ncbi:MAG: gamma-glutamyltransferase family protein [Polyangiales bacterium]
MSRITDQVDDAEPRAAASRRGTVVTSHPRAVEAGIAALEAGGSAVDAAVAAACVLGVVDPMSTSLGGDCFALVWNAEERTLHGFNGSGRAPALADAASLRAEGHDAVPTRGWKSITVPGALDAYAQLLERFGRMSLADALAPAVAAAEGFEVTPVVARDWAAAALVLEGGEGMQGFLPAPAAGERFAHPQLAQTLRAIAEGGVDVFYRGAFAQKLDEASRAAGGWLRADDLARHVGEWVVPLEGWYRGHPVYELPPNGQGIVVLEALALLEEHPLGDLDEVERTHLQIEALKLAFADAFEHVGDPDRSDVLRLLDPVYLEERAATLDAFVDRANDAATAGLPRGGDTVYVAVVDAEGNACSLIASTYEHFGSGVAVDGIVLQNRGALFVLDESHPSALAPGRRPYHTILPAMVFRHDLPWLVFGVVGGYQQPQAQVQLLVRTIDLGESIVDAVKAPRFRWLEGAKIRCEGGMDPALVEALRARGHEVVEAEAHGGFGGAQAIALEPEGPVGASDPRKDGVVGTTRPLVEA